MKNLKQYNAHSKKNVSFSKKKMIVIKSCIWDR